MNRYNIVLRNQLYDTAARPWEGDPTSLQAQLIQTMVNWSEISDHGDKPPVWYSSAETKECHDGDANQKTADQNMQYMRDAIGINIEGWVPNEEFESAREKAGILRSECAETANTDEEARKFYENWPLQDHEEID